MSRSASDIDLDKPFNEHLYVIFTTIVSVSVAAVFGGLIVWLFLRGQQAAVSERVRGKEEENARLVEELATARAVWPR